MTPGEEHNPVPKFTPNASPSMPVWIRRALLGLAALIVVAVGIGAWLIASFDPDRYKDVAIDWVKTNRDRTLAIDGPIKLSVFPRLEVRLSRISLSERGRADEFAALDEAELAVQLLPLLRGQVSVDRVRARGVRLAWLRDAQGRRNIDDLVVAGGVAAPATSNSPAASGAPIRLDVESIHLADVRARIKDESAGVDGEVLLKELDTGRIADQVPSRVRLVVQLGLKAPALKGELRGSCLVTPNLETGSMRVAEMDLGYKGDAPSASSIDASVKGELAYGATGALEAKALALRVSANTGALKLDDTRLDIGRFAHDPANKRFVLGQLTLRLIGTHTGRPLAMTLEWPELDVKGETLKGSGIGGQLTLGGDLPIEARIRSGAPGGNFDNLRVPGFEARLSSRAGARKIDGAVRSDVLLQTAKQALALEKLSVDLKLEDPALKPLALTLQGQAGVSAQSARWNVAGQLNANGFATDGTANLTQTIPAIKANVRFEALDLNTLLPEAAPAGSGGGGAAAADTPVDLSGLRGVNGSFAVRAGSIVARQVRVTDALLDATLETGLLRVSALQGKVWGGAVEATALADARASRVAIKALANGVNVQALLKDVAARDFLEGRGRVTADLDTAGRSVSEMRSRLKGQLGAQLRDGAVKGVNLAKSLRQAKAALAVRADASQRTSQAEKTDFSELNVSFVIDAGVARSHDLDLKSPFLRLGGEGAVDLGKGRVDYVARATVTDTSKGQDGADLSALKGLTIPVRLAGPFDALDWNIQWSAVASAAAKSQLEAKLKDRLGLPAGGASAPAAKDVLKEKAQDKVKDKLKGLLK